EPQSRGSTSRPALDKNSPAGSLKRVQPARAFSYLVVKRRPLRKRLAVPCKNKPRVCLSLAMCLPASSMVGPLFASGFHLMRPKRLIAEQPHSREQHATRPLLETLADCHA